MTNYDDALFDKIQHIFLMEISQQTKNKREFLQSDNGNLQNPPANIVLNAFLPRSRVSTPLIPLLFNNLLELVASGIRQEKELERKKEEVKPYLYADNMNVYVEIVVGYMKIYISHIYIILELMGLAKCRI